MYLSQLRIKAFCVTSDTFYILILVLLYLKTPEFDHSVYHVHKINMGHIPEDNLCDIC